MQDKPSTALRSGAGRPPGPGALNPLYQSGQQEAKAGNHAKAAALFRRCLDSDTRHADAWLGLAVALKKLGDLAGSGAAFRTAIKLRPKAADAHIGLAEIYRRQGLLEKALASCETGQQYETAIGEGHIIRSTIRRDLGQADEAIADLMLVVARHPHALEVRSLLSKTLCDLNRLEAATEVLEQGISLFPREPALFETLTRVLLRQQRLAEATRAWEAMLDLKEGDAEAYRCLGFFYQELGRKQDAFDAYQKALAINPRFRKAYNNLATLLMADYRYDLAESIFRFVTALEPEEPGVHHNLGVILRLRNQFEEAAVHYRRALAIRPDFVESLVDLGHIRQHFCDWDGLDAQNAILCAKSFPLGIAMSPFALLTISSSPADHLRNARLEAIKVKQLANRTLATYAPRPLEARGQRLKIGYVSTDFHTHPTAMLMVELLEHHDKARFEIFGYSLGPDEQSPLRARLIKTFETFRDLRGIATAATAQQIHADGIDILIDLKGYTQDARFEIFAARPAPIQVNYLGYPGTTGADFMDYIIVDKTVAPPEHAVYFDEKLVHLPHCYQPNDRKRAVADWLPTRAECGLPETGFVFCCFNNTYKITETIFDLWLRILHATPGAVLWLLEPNPQVARNLRQAASARGLSLDRLVFAPRVSPDRHIARMRVADLFLDTLPVNAHTTASEALWAGLPVLTCMGDAFVGRVAASLLKTVDLPDLITTSLADYQTKAIALVSDGPRMARYRDTLHATRMTTPLFDTVRYTRSFEAALAQMGALRDAGLPPVAFAVDDQC